MAHRVLELTLVSGHNLKDVNVFSRMEVYAITSVFGDPGTRRVFGDMPPSDRAAHESAYKPTAADGAGVAF
ncbi:unnamed protein product [Triticum turgidum subsp. durum]|uniref:Uncharacterized protein n=1 Tax=Triticum turgidum subsp. durum TaxID=4567 RepID=A0A9R1RI94_TRITD|nr:unnamed protein product [Triticum turgidum subsp. durum]